MSDRRLNPDIRAPERKVRQRKARPATEAKEKPAGMMPSGGFLTQYSRGGLGGDPRLRRSDPMSS
jgi:hypothetical protein